MRQNNDVKHLKQQEVKKQLQISEIKDKLNYDKHDTILNKNLNKQQSEIDLLKKQLTKSNIENKQLKEQLQNYNKKHKIIQNKQSSQIKILAKRLHNLHNKLEDNYLKEENLIRDLSNDLSSDFNYELKDSENSDSYTSPSMNFMQKSKHFFMWIGSAIIFVITGLKSFVVRIWMKIKNYYHSFMDNDTSEEKINSNDIKNVNHKDATSLSRVRKNKDQKSWFDEKW